jgi:hypothetical protein
MVAAAVDVAAVVFVVGFAVEFVGTLQPKEASDFTGSQHQLRQGRLL